MFVLLVFAEPGSEIVLSLRLPNPPAAYLCRPTTIITAHHGASGASSAVSA
jgi:hypothetical protein